MTPHHLQRPRTAGLVLQPRDLELLNLVVNHRFVKSDHLRALLGQRMPQRVLQVRLQKLSHFRYLRRLYVPVVLDGVHAPLTHSRQPIYTLDSRGVQLLRDLTSPGRPVLYERPEQPSYHFLSHHLIATDCLVALTVACRHTLAVNVLATEAESLLWRKLRSYRRERQTVRALVPDGAFTLHYPATGEVVTFYLEVVRADVKGGNAALLGKFRRYGELNRQGFFQKVYGHDRVRAVLFATTSPARAAHLTALANQLTEARRLLWFGPYQEQLSAGRLVSLFTPERLLSLPWKDGAGTTVTLVDPTVRPPSGDGPY